MRVAGIQFDTVWEDPAASMERATPWIAAAAAAGARLCVLPEMFGCGFSMAAQRFAEASDGPTSCFLAEQARRHNMWLCGGVPEQARDTALPFNSLVLVGPGGQLFRYRKIHPFTYAEEHKHYGAGTEFVTVHVEGLRCTLFICYDLRFANEFWATAHDTDCYIVAANWPARRREHWKTLLRARAIENQAWLLGVNRVGGGGGLHYSGDSQIIDPSGELVATAAAQETMIMADIDAETVQQTRQSFPVLNDRRSTDANNSNSSLRI